MDGAPNKVDTCFPKDLVEWTGDHSGGVKRLFDAQSGRSGMDLLRTNLISKLEAWASAIASQVPDTPRILLLVGGPGNGKTEAIEHTIRCLDEGLAAEGRLIEKIVQECRPPMGQAVPRVIRASTGSLASSHPSLELEIVQDASATAGYEGSSAAVLLINEIRLLLEAPQSRVYLCCVNRGVLDDALIHALDNDLEDTRILLESITRAVSLSVDSPSCWPLEDYPEIAIWPMDAETLLASPDSKLPSPAALLLEHATRSDYWPPQHSCDAGDRCPFCHSQALLSREDHRSALLNILRWYELSSGKRWSFRDLRSLISYLLAGHFEAKKGMEANPCKRAKHLLLLDKPSEVPRRTSRQELTAIFYLATSSYQHALFHRWSPDISTSLRQDLKDLGFAREDQNARILWGLQQFLQERGTPYLPATISTLLDSLAELIDPALASPDSEVAISGNTRIVLGDLDTQFSRSLTGGIEFIRRYRALMPNEQELLRRLAQADSYLSIPAVRRKKPTAASRIQRTLRDFACRLVRRSICTRSAVIADADILRSFQQVVEDEQGPRLYEVAQQVQDLLNTPHGFEVSLTTTFGQPLPPQQRQAILVVLPQSVQPLPLSIEGRPRSPIRFLQVGQGNSRQSIALTYDLFKAVKELDRGMSPASLPKTVVALLDTTRARLSGPIVRDQQILANARIRIGAEGVEIGQSWNGFNAIKKGGRA